MKNLSRVSINRNRANNGGVLEVLSSEKGSWTILVTMPNGVSCMLATGQSWEALKPMIAGDAT